jgi:predicted RNA-binding Zn ribbon-like protein
LFCNTVENYREPEQLDTLTDFSGWVAWSVRHGLVEEDSAKKMSFWAAENEALAAAALEDAKALRLKLFRLLSARAAGIVPTQEQLAFLNTRLASSLTHLRVVAHADELAWRWEEKVSPERLLWPIAYAAAMLLADPQCSRLRQCGGDKCTWLFMDESRNRSRRWCDMTVCGNRAKSRKHYQRTHRVTG